MTNQNNPLKIGVLISGSGTNLQALIDCIAEGTLNAEIVTVISSRPDAYGLVRAREANIPTVSLNREIYLDPAIANEAIATELVRAGAEYVVMAGYMRMVTPEVLNASTCIPRCCLPSRGRMPFKTHSILALKSRALPCILLTNSMTRAPSLPSVPYPCWKTTRSNRLKSAFTKQNTNCIPK